MPSSGPPCYSFTMHRANRRAVFGSLDTTVDSMSSTQADLVLMVRLPARTELLSSPFCGASNKHQTFLHRDGLRQLLPLLQSTRTRTSTDYSIVVTTRLLTGVCSAAAWTDNSMATTSCFVSTIQVLVRSWMACLVALPRARQYMANKANKAKRKNTQHRLTDRLLSLQLLKRKNFRWCPPTYCSAVLSCSHHHCHHIARRCSSLIGPSFDLLLHSIHPTTKEEARSAPTHHAGPCRASLSPSMKARQRTPAASTEAFPVAVYWHADW
ncbi:hypothetical protein V8C37DRAFT_369291 [Trichoderma ceciliae]